MEVNIKINVTYKIQDYPHLVFGEKMLINLKSGKIKKQSYKNGVIGYWLDSKTFKSIKWIKNNLIKINNKEQIPF